MKFNFKNIWVLVLTIVLGHGSYLLGRCGVIETCEKYKIFGKYSFSLFEPILLYSIAVTPLALILLFVGETSFSRWFRFATWWIPLSVVLIAFSQTDSHSWMPLFPDATKENVAWLMGSLFTVISLIQIKRHSRTSVRKRAD